MLKDMKGFENACKLYLTSLGIGDLRNYGRELGVSRPTAKNKDDLIAEVIDILCGRLAPISVSTQGAPVKNARVDERIIQRMAAIKAEFFYAGEEVKPVSAPAPTQKEEENIPPKPVKGLLPKLQMKDGFFREQYGNMIGARRNLLIADGVPQYRFVNGGEGHGQCHFNGEVWLVLPLTYAFPAPRMYLDEETVAKRQINEGDVVKGPIEADGDSLYMVTVWSINGEEREASGETRRFQDFERVRGGAQYRLFQEKCDCPPSVKYIDWCAPLIKGESFVVYGAPKTGKTNLLLEIATNLRRVRNTQIYALLTEEAIVKEFEKRIDTGNVACVRQNDDPSISLYATELLFTRAKRQATLGTDVVLLIDSLSALARAFNDLEIVEGKGTFDCGLEVKTVELLKGYLQTACILNSGGSITVIATACKDSGDPFDERLADELSKVVSGALYLDNRLAFRGVYPAIDFIQTAQEAKAKGGDNRLREALCKLSPTQAVEAIATSASLPALQRKLLS